MNEYDDDPQDDDDTVYRPIKRSYGEELEDEE